MHVSAAGRDLDPPSGFSVPYALQTLLDELTMRPVVLRDGTPEEIDPLTDGGVVEFGEPIGDGRDDPHPALRAAHVRRQLRLPRRRASGFPCRRICSTLRELTQAPEAEIRRIAGEAVPPSARTFSVHLVEASGGGRSVRVRALTEPNDAWGLGGGIVSTAAPAAAAVRLLARGSIEARGAVPPERCIEPAEMFAELERHGCTFEITTREEVRA